MSRGDARAPPSAEDWHVEDRLIPVIDERRVAYSELANLIF